MTKKWKPKREFLQETSQRLNRDLPKSEVWFWSEWERLGMKCHYEQPNQIFFGFIPDVLNRKSLYIIEIDGSIHDEECVKKRDKRKDAVFKSQGFAVFRIKHNDLEGLKKVAELVSERRNKLFVSRKRTKKLNRNSEKMLCDSRKRTKKKKIKNNRNSANFSTGKNGLMRRGGKKNKYGPGYYDWHYTGPTKCSKKSAMVDAILAKLKD